ncbi:MAG: hypothetical protein SV775_13520 [Thermodesulfobacteriota bacterium]|nr:hypothetical protein [Thermodesulfobacteriota bacterium]
MTIDALKLDPLQLPVFYRKFLNIDFHGTGHLFERMDSRNVFVLLWTTVSLSRGEIINFNPILADAETAEIDDRVKRIEHEAKAINIHYLDLDVLEHFSQQLHKDGISFIFGTGFQLKVDPETQALEIAYIDIEKDVEELESLSKRLAGTLISEMPGEDLKSLEVLFSKLESFYQNHLTLLNQAQCTLELPERQKSWFEKTQDLRQALKSNFHDVMFRPESVYTDFGLLYRHAPSLLDFVLPEFTALRDLTPSWHLYMTLPVTHYIINAARKLQALVGHDKESFQDIKLLHRLAQREFGPMATGTVGVNESHIEDLEKIIERLCRNRVLFDSLIKSFIFQDLGRVPALREKYRDEINPADLAHVGAFFIEKERIAERYDLDAKGKAYLIFLVRHHGLLHHIVRGELSFSAIQGILDSRDKDVFDAFFVFSFIMLSSIRDDLILDDLASQLFQIKTICDKIINNETTLEAELNEVYAQRGKLFYALEEYQTNGLPKGVTPGGFLESERLEKTEKWKRISSGRMIFALVRLFRLRGIRYVEFFDLVNLMLNVPLEFIHKKRRFSSIGFATYEKEVYEAFRIYKTLQNLSEETRHFILDELVDDRVRIFGYEKVSGYLSYENQIKLLLLGLLGAGRLEPNGSSICLNFLGLSEKIEKRYEAINDYLNTMSIERIWEDKHQVNQLFKAKTGVLLKKEAFPNVLSLDFQERVNISHKIAYMDTINNVEQLKDYFHYSLRSLRKHVFFTEDYELQLEKAFERRHTEITDMILNRTKKKMDLIEDFKELHNSVNDLLDQSWDIGFSDEQKHRLNDLYELRKDSLKRKKISEIDSFLDSIHDVHELKDYWDSIKYYLQNNHRFFGKEFEYLIAKKFDRKKNGIKA